MREVDGMPWWHVRLGGLGGRQGGIAAEPSFWLLSDCPFSVLRALTSGPRLSLSILNGMVSFPLG